MPGSRRSARDIGRSGNRDPSSATSGFGADLAAPVDATADAQPLDRTVRGAEELTLDVLRRSVQDDDPIGTAERHLRRRRRWWLAFEARRKRDLGAGVQHEPRIVQPQLVSIAGALIGPGVRPEVLDRALLDGRLRLLDVELCAVGPAGDGLMDEVPSRGVREDD